MIIFGKNTVLEALKSEFKSEELFVDNTSDKSNKIPDIIAIAKTKNVKLTFVNSKQLSKIAGTEDHQSVALKIDYKPYPSLKKFSDSKEIERSFIYVYDSQLTHNVGAIARTAECAGLGGVILPHKIDITPANAKTSVGSVFNIPIINESIFEAIKVFKQNGYKIFAIERGGETYYEQDIEGNCLFIIGGEDKSLGENIIERCDGVLTIPQFGKVNSLNMSVATSIIVYEHVRQRLINNQDQSSK